MRTGRVGPQVLHEPSLKVVGHGVFKALSFFVDLVPFHRKYFGQHSLDQVVPPQQLRGNLPPARRQADYAGGTDPQQTVAFEPSERGGHGRGGHTKAPAKNR